MAAPPARARADYDTSSSCFSSETAVSSPNLSPPLPLCRPSICARSGCFRIVFFVPCDSVFRLGSGTQISLRCRWLRKNVNGRMNLTTGRHSEVLLV